MARRDGRGLFESRELSASTGGLDRADGSGRFGFGPVVSLASFSGPIEVRIRDERVDRATLEVVHRPLDQVASTPSRALVSAFDQILPPLLTLSYHPRSLAQLVVQSLTPSTPSPSSSSSASYSTFSSDPSDLSSDPSDPSSSTSTSWPTLSKVVNDQSPPHPPGLLVSDRASALNAASIAIMHAASISMRGVPVAVSFAYLPSSSASSTPFPNPSSSVLVLDPDAEEERLAFSRHVFGWVFSSPATRTTDSRDPDGDVKISDEEGKAELSGSETMVWAESEGKFTRAEFEKAREVSKSAAKEVLDFIRGEMEAAALK